MRASLLELPALKHLKLRTTQSKQQKRLPLDPRAVLLTCNSRSLQSLEIWWDDTLTSAALPMPSELGCMKRLQSLRISHGPFTTTTEDDARDGVGLLSAVAPALE